MPGKAAPTPWQSGADEGDVSCIVVGTETGHVLVLNPVNFSVLAKIALPRYGTTDHVPGFTSATHAATYSVAAFMSISGQFEVDYRIICACRDGFVYTIKGCDYWVLCLASPDSIQGRGAARDLSASLAGSGDNPVSADHSHLTTH